VYDAGGLRGNKRVGDSNDTEDCSVTVRRVNETLTGGSSLANLGEGRKGESGELSWGSTPGRGQDAHWWDGSRSRRQERDRRPEEEGRLQQRRDASRNADAGAKAVQGKATQPGWRIRSKLTGQFGTNWPGNSVKVATLF